MFDADGNQVADCIRCKIGDGINTVTNLDFTTQVLEQAIAEKSQVQIITWEADD